MTNAAALIACLPIGPGPFALGQSSGTRHRGVSDDHAEMGHCPSRRAIARGSSTHRTQKQDHQGQNQGQHPDTPRVATHHCFCVADANRIQLARPDKARSEPQAPSVPPGAIRSSRLFHGPPGKYRQNHQTHQKHHRTKKAGLRTEISPAGQWVLETISPRIWRLGVRLNWR